jgi:alpha-ketoglutarate-dependent taurine dioxygenase
VSQNRLLAKLNNKPVELDQFILELHQDEILAMPFEVVKKLVSSCRLMNDLRTIFIAHDKRFLTLLSKSNLIKQTLTETQLGVIKKNITFSCISNELKEDFELKNEIVEHQNDWLVKPCMSGKGKGILFGKNMSQTEWEETIEKLSNLNEFVIQKYINQAKFELVHYNKDQAVDHKPKSVYNIVGTLLCYDEKFFGPGIYRASCDKDIIAVSQGGFILYPVVEESHTKQTELHLTSESLFKLSNNSNPTEECLQKIKHALLTKGIVLIDMDSTDAESKYLMNLIKLLDMTPYSHSSKGDDFIWHIRPLFEEGLIQDSIDKHPRSHTSEVFTMHTDASYEKIPPRFFAIQVIEPDSMNGGESLFIKLDSVLSKLTQSEIDVLSRTLVKIKIPTEFVKDLTKRHIEGTILCRETDYSCNKLIRFRHDIIENTDALSFKFQNALSKLERLIDIENRELVKRVQLKRNQIILVDNSRWLHGRTKILDNNRHYVRVRFQTKDAKFLPW